MPKRQRARAQTPSRPPARQSRGVTYVWLLLVAAVTVLYGRTLGFDYVRADDTDLVRDNQAFLGDLANAPAAFAQSYFAVAGQADPQAYYRPLVVLSLMLDAQLTGSDPALYHATNVVLHTVAVLLVFVLLRRLGGSVTAAGTCALLLAVHPANVQTVAWIVGRNDSLMTIFAVLSLLALLRLLERPGRAETVAHVGCLALALFTKETAVLLVGLYGLLVWSRTGTLDWFRQHAKVPAAYAVVAGLWYAARSAVLAGQPSAGLGLLEHVRVVLGNLPQLVLYAGKALIPARPSVMPGVDVAGLLAGAVAIVIGFLMLRLLPWRSAVLAGGWFLLFLLPVLAIPGLPAYEHRLYFPLIGLATGASELATTRGWRLLDRAPLVAVVGVVVLLASVAHRQTGVFRDATSYWESATTGTPHAPIALVNLGRMAEERGRLDRAERLYREALELDPTIAKANNNLGTIFARREQYEEARRLFELELANHPANVEALFNLGLLYEVTGAAERSVEFWDRAILADPRFRPAYDELIAHFEGRGDAERAASYRERLADAAPGSP